MLYSFSKSSTYSPYSHRPQCQDGDQPKLDSALPERLPDTLYVALFSTTRTKALLPWAMWASRFKRRLVRCHIGRSTIRALQQLQGARDLDGAQGTRAGLVDHQGGQALRAPAFSPETTSCKPNGKPCVWHPEPS